ncbi:hypothetical protein BDV96DRAFT_675401 [Lophiotrema nucula]|uniref:Mid2 domain-containing protein n=1 Tax=Lophiotrema nucula TaxID=690887 RepID=A0A6A5YJ83_9PLEO|nr:hypothetical protein BDV96DRAFT_675401 [Lophiotrema nucula]
MSVTVSSSLPYLTSFAAPEHCNTPLLLCFGACSSNNPLALSFTCSNGVPSEATECFQDGAHILSNARTETQNNFIYSGSACPSDLTGVQTTISSGTTQIQCCPPSFSRGAVSSASYCFGESSMLLATLSYAPLTKSTQSNTESPGFLQSFITTLGTGTSSTTYSAISAVKVADWVFAVPIQVVLQDSTTPTSTAAEQGSRPSAPTSRVTPSTDANLPSVSKISNGAKIGMGVSIPFVGIAAALAIFLLIRRRKRRRRESQGPTDRTSGEVQFDTEVEGYHGVTPGEKRWEKAELQANHEHQLVELDAGACLDEIRIHELPTESRRRDSHQ